MIEEPLVPAQPEEQVHEEPIAVPIVRGQWVWRWAVPLAIFAGFLILYLSTHTRWYTFDSVSYATDIREYSLHGNSAELVHPHHLLFNTVGYGFWKLLGLLGLEATTLEATQIMNSIIGAFLLAAFYRLLVSRGFRWGAPPKQIAPWPIVEIAATLCLGVSFGFWSISTDGRVNAPALLMLTLTIGYAWGAIDNLDRGQVAMCVLWSVLSVAFHQSHGLLIGFVLTCILLALAPQVHRFKSAAAYLVSTGCGIAALYGFLGVFAAGHTSLDKLFKWALIYSEDGRWWKMDFWNNFVDLNTRAYGQAFIAGPPTLAEGSMEPWQADLLEFLRLAVMPLLTGIVVIGVLFVVRNAIRERHNPEWRRVAALIALAIPYTIFFTVWDPGYWVFWIPLTVATLALVAILPYRSAGWIRVPVAIVLVAWAGASVTANASANFIRRTQVAVNPELVALLEVAKLARDGDLMLTTGIGSGAKFEVYAPYFASLDVSVGHMELKRAGGDFEIAKASIRGKIASTLKAGHRVFIGREYYVPQQWEAIGKRYRIPVDAQALILDGYGRAEVPTGSMVRIFCLEPKPARKPPAIPRHGWLFPR